MKVYYDFMLTMDDLKAIRDLLRPVESDVRDVRRKIANLDFKIEGVERRLQNSINQTVDIFD